jgi:hypothetical protein
MGRGSLADFYKKNIAHLRFNVVADRTNGVRLCVIPVPLVSRDEQKTQLRVCCVSVLQQLLDKPLCNSY